VEDSQPAKYVGVGPRDHFEGHQGLRLYREDGLTPRGLGGGRADKAVQCGHGLTVRFGRPLGGYPAGSKMLTGKDRKYVIAPLSRIVEESYTTYLEWTGGAAAL
jgi:hypothetical protein